MYNKVLAPSNEDFGFTKFCISKRMTGLDYDLWCDCLGKTRQKDFEPFVMICKIMGDSEVWLSIKICDSPCIICGCLEAFENLDRVLKYIKVNKDELLKHWSGVIDDLDLYQKLRSKKHIEY